VRRVALALLLAAGAVAGPVAWPADPAGTPPSSPAAAALSNAAPASHPVTPVGIAAFRAELASARGHAVVLNLWASWCAPCLKEIPVLLEVERRFAACGVRVVGLATDDPGELDGPVRAMHAKFFPGFRSFARTEGDPDAYASVVDPAWNELMPTTYVIDADGTVRTRLQGAKSAAEFEQAVQAVAKCDGQGGGRSEVQSAGER
jgi:cytochrome c biogenesis protein CcmG/thiol:disulfide interchange protein DsbE